MYLLSVSKWKIIGQVRERRSDHCRSSSVYRNSDGIFI